MPVGTTATVPWWWVAALAGGFTLLGVAMTLISTAWVARAKNRLDDARRFESDLLQIYVDLNDFVDVLHNNAQGDPEQEKQVYWDTYRATVKAVSRLEVLAPRRVYDVARDFQQLVWRFAPGFDDADHPMVDLVDKIEELRSTVRRELRIPD